MCKAPYSPVGAGRAQFNEVQSAEIPQIAAACAELGESAGEHYAPLITFSAPVLAPVCAETLTHKILCIHNKYARCTCAGAGLCCS